MEQAYRSGLSAGEQATRSKFVDRSVSLTASNATTYSAPDCHRAEVAELADALDSGSSARKGVGVQIPPSAPSSIGAAGREAAQDGSTRRPRPGTAEP